MNDDLLLADWACLGVLYTGRTHGFAIAKRLGPDGDLGRVWSISRALTYRSLQHLAERGLAEPVGEEPGRAGGTRTIYAITRAGRAALREWLGTPVQHLRDLRTELLLKLLVADLCGLDMAPMLGAQRARVAEIASALSEQAELPDSDAVSWWRAESAQAALRVVDRVVSARQAASGAERRAPRTPGPRARAPR